MNSVEATTLYTDDLYRVKFPVLVVLGTSWSGLTGEQVTLLSKILGSVRCSLDSVKILEQTSLDMDRLLLYQPEYVLVFGAQADASIPRYQASQLSGIPVLIADAIPDLDDARKKSLWVGLKQLFKL